MCQKNLKLHSAFKTIDDVSVMRPYVQKPFKMATFDTGALSYTMSYVVGPQGLEPLCLITHASSVDSCADMISKVNCFIPVSLDDLEIEAVKTLICNWATEPYFPVNRDEGANHG